MRLKLKKDKFIFILFALALLLRIIYIFSMDNKNLGAWGDEGWKIAKNLVEGKGYKMYLAVGELASARPPVFPLFLAGIFLIFGQSILITKITLAVFNTLISLVVLLLGRKMFNTAVGLIAFVISLFYPPFIYWGSMLGPDTLTILFLALAVLFLLKIEENHYLYAFLSGLFTGILIMTRSMAYPLLFLFSVWLTLLFNNLKIGLKLAAVFLVSASLVILPWVIRNYKIHHTFLLASTEGGFTFYAAHNSEVYTKGGGDFYVLNINPEEVRGLSEVQTDRYFYKKGLNFIKENPKIYFRLLLERLIRFWRPYPHITGLPDTYSLRHVIILFLIDTPIILLGFLGLWRLFRKNKSQAFLITLIFFNFMFVSMLVRSSIRYRAPIMPYLIILASYAISLGYLKIKNNNGQ